MIGSYFHRLRAAVKVILLPLLAISLRLVLLFPIIDCAYFRADFTVDNRANT